MSKPSRFQSSFWWHTELRLYFGNYEAQKSHFEMLRNPIRLQGDNCACTDSDGAAWVAARNSMSDTVVLHCKPKSTLILCLPQSPERCEHPLEFALANNIKNASRRLVTQINTCTAHPEISEQRRERALNNGNRENSRMFWCIFITGKQRLCVFFIFFLLLNL